ncbi:MAG: cation transporter [Gemmatimonadaceae bacterium]|nr:cation transporter [Chitinophagaceae bacterium]
MTPGKENVKIQRWVVAVAVVLFLIKVFAYFLTRSVSVLTDALESTVNVAAGFIGLYSLHVSAKPKDSDHPYGHGKAEFLSAAVEGSMIFIAGIIIIYQSIDALIHPHEIRRLNTGIYLIAFTSIVNFVLGYITVRYGRKNNSLALIASGKHLQTDTYSSIGLIIGLILILLTGYMWLDSVVAIIFAFIVIITGYKIVRSSIAGIMDEADDRLLLKMLKVLNENRRENWIDLHNLRVIKYGGQLHVDCHLTVPWYLNVVEAHVEIDMLIALIKKEFGDAIEFFVHTDPCLDFSCSICAKTLCDVRARQFERRVPWTMENVLSNKKHSLQNELQEIRQN